MKRYNFTRITRIPKYKFNNKMVSASDINDGDDEDIEDNTNDWHEKAVRLQARRWRKIKHQLA